MSTTTQVTLEQYYEMLPNYEREPEFDDGEIVERPMPQSHIAKCWSF